MAHAVVSASLGALGPLLRKLTGLLAGEYGRLKGVRREILALNLELSCMHAAVQKYAMLEDPDVQVKQWISMVRELAYDMEDCMDTFILRLGNGGRRHGGFKESFRKIARSLKTLGARRGIAGQIEELKARIKQVKELKDSYKLNDAPSRTPTCSTSNHTAVDPRLSAFFAEEAHLVGIDGPRDDLVKWMVDEGKNTATKHRSVLSIVGFGGLGKTTLANQVYVKIKGDFDCVAFVSISQKPDIKRIIQNIISQVSKEYASTDTDNWDEWKSITKLRELLKDKRYLIIIDDIWSTQAWSDMKGAFPENNYSSRIIATTRVVDVAKSCCSGAEDRIYEMEALSDLQSRRLFFSRIFGSNDCCPDMMLEVSEKILKKCGGLPLAIISISGLLANKSVIKEEWESVTRSIGSALENNRSLEGMNSILSLSYNDLSPNLKTCLMYLSVFPEDYEITRGRLVRRWIAEGFISEERGQTQYEVAERYFYELINKNLLQPVNIGLDGKAEGCRVHDMILEILITKSVEDNFITVVGGGQRSLSNRHDIIRRLSIQHIDHQIALELANEDLSHVRSLTVTASDCRKHLPNLARFKALRVIDFESCNGLEQYDFSCMDKLLQLKYLNLNGTDISRLPSQIGMLSNLESLEFSDLRVRELPAGFLHLTKLQHLSAGAFSTVPSGIGIMSNLEVIVPFNATMSPTKALEELGTLTRLRELSISLECEGSVCKGPNAYTTCEETLFSSLYKLIGSSKLQSLIIYNYDGHSLRCLESWSPVPSALQNLQLYNSRLGNEYYFTKVPNWIAPSSLASLSMLHICLSELTEDGLHTLGELPALLSLFVNVEKPEYKIIVQGVGFIRLKHLRIFGGPGWKGTYVTFVEGAMPRLEYLFLELKVSLGRNYVGFAHLPCLKRAIIHLVSGGATDSEIIASRAAIREELDGHTNHPITSICTRAY